MSGRFNLDDYIPVQERISRFWNDYPDGRIETDLMSDPTDYQSCRYIARVYKRLDDPKPSATGWAFEHVTERGPNQTSHEEVAETSAIGRALANMGYATSQKDRPSREEMAKVERGASAPRQNAPAPQQAPPVPLEARLQADVERITARLKGTLTGGEFNLLRREIDNLGLGKHEAISILVTEVEQRMAEARAARQQQQPALA